MSAVRETAFLEIDRQARQLNIKSDKKIVREAYTHVETEMSATM
jgi:hypothetical protein